MYEKFERLLRERNLTPYRVSRDTGIAQSSLSDWKRVLASLRWTSYRYFRITSVSHSNTFLMSERTYVLYGSMLHRKYESVNRRGMEKRKEGGNVRTS